jgi:hypothetical protein
VTASVDIVRFEEVTRAVAEGFKEVGRVTLALPSAARLSHPAEVTHRRGPLAGFMECGMWEVGKMSVPVAYEVRVVGRVGPAAWRH